MLQGTMGELMQSYPPCSGPLWMGHREARYRGGRQLFCCSGTRGNSAELQGAGSLLPLGPRRSSSCLCLARTSWSRGVTGPWCIYIAAIQSRALIMARCGALGQRQEAQMHGSKNQLRKDYWKDNQRVSFTPRKQGSARRSWHGAEPAASVLQVVGLPGR